MFALSSCQNSYTNHFCTHIALRLHLNLTVRYHQKWDTDFWRKIKGRGEWVCGFIRRVIRSKSIPLHGKFSANFSEEEEVMIIKKRRGGIKKRGGQFKNFWEVETESTALKTFPFKSNIKNQHFDEYRQKITNLIIL